MALDLTGISNENEFYTSHYLAAILEDDLKDLFAAWTKAEEEGKGRPPADVLLSLSRDYSRLRTDLARERDPEERLALQRPFLSSFLAALGFRVAPTVKELADGAIPVLAEVTKRNGAPELWILETVETEETEADASDPLSLAFLPVQLPLPDAGSEPLALPSEEGEPLTLDEILTEGVFSLPEPPRWVVVLNHGLVVLADRTKWNQKRFLRFDLAELYGRRNPGTFKAVAALLHRDSLAPEGGLSLLDTLDESSHKHAFAVSDDLKYSVREAVELLGNEALYDLRERLREKVYGRELEKPLTEECLRYLYRLLFCFYVEARPELGYAPMKSEEYRTGYSLEALRDLELQDLTTEESKNGFFLNDSVATLFRLVYEGFRHEVKQTVLGADQEGVDRHTFRMEPLRSHLFDPQRTPTLNRVRFRNHVLQKVLECLSLSRPRRGRGNRATRRGRISYAQLGINQLGAVYEGLLSYTGFFAEEDLYEVRRAGDEYDELKNAYFVKAENLPKYTDEEKLFDGGLKKYPKGTFIYRLAGRNREKSASYYTPEVLTRCVVKYALKELLKDRPADDILSLTVCEPALGSGAFANEAVNQLAEAYLERKQLELKRSIAHDKLILEKQKVKAYIADNNVHGVDLNPTAVELAEISLWLNTIYAGHTIPWFGNQLVVGNSLVGARRQVFQPKPASRKTNYFVFEGVPDRVKLGESRPEGAVYHFLAPDAGMCAYNDQVIRELAPAEIKTIKEWKAGLGEPFSASELKTLRRLSASIDRLWQKHVEERRKLRADTRNTFPVFGHEDDAAFSPPPAGRKLSTGDKDRLYRQCFLAEGVQASSPYRRLKTVMDYWCALWFWPIEKAGLLPGREEFLLDLTVLLEGTSQGVALVGRADQTTLFPDDTPRQEALKLVDDFGFVDVAKLTREMPRLATVLELAEKHRFLHWELEFAEVFADHGGFDLIVGNPPWIKVEWNEGGVLGDFEPLLCVRDVSAPDVAKIRTKALHSDQTLRQAYCDEYVAHAGLKALLGSGSYFPLLEGVSPNLYKAFLPRVWDSLSDRGAAGLLHPEGIYEHPKGQALRAEAYRRLRNHFQFENELLLFNDIGGTRRFSANVYGPVSEQVSFRNVANLFSVHTLEACTRGAISGFFDPTELVTAPRREALARNDVEATEPVPGIKDDLGRWETRGHPDRLLVIEKRSLGSFARLYDDPGTKALEARLPVVHSKQLLAVIEKLGGYEDRLRSWNGDWTSTELWNETGAVKAGTLRRETAFPDSSDQLVLSGPHLHVGNPCFKTPRRECVEKSDYDTIDLTEMPEGYLPRTNYILRSSGLGHASRVPTLPWAPDTPITAVPRVAARMMLPAATERTLFPALIPAGPGHIHGVVSIASRSLDVLVRLLGCAQSLPVDFFIRSTGRANLVSEALALLPVAREHSPAILVRVLRLNCLTTHYSQIWGAMWRPEFARETWTRADERLSNDSFVRLTHDWVSAVPIRTDMERRQALVELDVLVSRQFGLSLDELVAVYRLQFSVLRQNEGDTWYDRNGRIVFTCSKGLPGVGLDRARWNEVKGMKAGTVTRTISDDTLPGGPRERTITYVAPFDRCDREADYRTAWAEFARRETDRASG
jgi:hypothetical protein